MYFSCITQINRNKIFNNIPIILQLIENIFYLYAIVDTRKRTYQF